MLPLPRIAIGAVQPGVTHRPMLWAMLEALRQQGLQIQTFASQARFVHHRATAAISGAAPRHLDSWLMSPELCRDLFATGAEDCDLAVVEGEFHPAGQSAATTEPVGGRLETLCQWLDLPRLVVLDASQLGSALPEPPEQIDGVLLDRVDSGPHQARLAIEIETQWEVPVLASLGPLPELRKQLQSADLGIQPPAESVHQLGVHFQRSGEPERIVEIASRKPMTWCSTPMPSVPTPLSDVTIALAYDEAFNCYFPDTLDLLELRGAAILDFSPLHDERLPRADVVYLGCGHPENHAQALAENDCMRLALREHVLGGGRIYAEGGGVAYLCHQMEDSHGQLQRMVGLLPAVAHRHDWTGREDRARHADPSQRAPDDQPPRPVAATIDDGCWLGTAGQSLLGYLDNRWRLELRGACHTCLKEAEHQRDLIQCGRVIGSRIHLDFAAQLHLLQGFFQPCEATSDDYDPWSIL